MAPNGDSVFIQKCTSNGCCFSTSMIDQGKDIFIQAMFRSHDTDSCLLTPPTPSSFGRLKIKKSILIHEELCLTLPILVANSVYIFL